MSRRPALCTEADIRRAVKVAKAHGMAVRIDPNGAINIVPSETPGPPVAPPTVLAPIRDFRL